MGAEEDAKLLFNQQPIPELATPYVDEESNWAHAHTSPSGLEYFHPQPQVMKSETAEGSAARSTLVAPSASSSTASRSPSPHPPDLYEYGTLNADQRTWRCAYPGCHSKAMFVRPCDLRKHFHRHSKNFFCRHEDCPQSREGGFSSKKDRARHETKHNPGVPCEWEGCDRIFSRLDNMRNHMNRS